MDQKNKHLDNPYTKNYIQNIFKVKNRSFPFGASAKLELLFLFIVLV